MKDILLQTDMMILFGTLIVVLLIAAILYIKYDIIRLGGIVGSLKKLSGAGKELPVGQKERMDALLAMAVSSENRVLKTVWTDFYREYTDVMKAEIVPDSAYYFNEYRLIEVPGARSLMERLTGILFILGFAGALLYPALVLLGIAGSAVPGSILRGVGLALLLLAAVALLMFIFRIADAARIESARSSLWEFQYQLAGWLNPVSEPTEIGVLVESQRQNSLDFQAAVARLENRLDLFETKTLVPVLSERFEAAINKNITPVLTKSSDVLAHLSKELVTRQENGMKELATVFTEKVTAVTAERLNAFADKTTEITGTLSTVVSGMNRIQEVMDESTRSQNEMSERSFYALEKAAETHTQVSEALGASLDSVRAAETVAAEMREYAVKGLDKADAMALQSLQLMEGSLSQIKTLQDGITGLAYTLQSHTDNAVARVSEELTTAVGKYEEIFAQIETSRKQHSEDTDAKIGQMIGGLDQRLTDYSWRVLESNTTTADKLSDAASAISLSGSQLMEQINAQADTILNEITSKLDTSSQQITGDLAKAIAGYTEVSARMEETRVQHTEELDNRLSRLINETNTQLTEYSERIAATHVQTEDKLAAFTADMELSGRRLLGQVDEQVIRMFSDITGKLDASTTKIADDLTRAVTGYTEVSNKIEASRAQYALDMDTRLMELLQNTNESLTNHSEKILESNARTAETLSTSAAQITMEGSRVLERADRQVSDLYSDLLKRMDQSIAAMGDTLAANMRAAMGDSIEIVEKLAIKTTEMKEMYDDYFTRVADQSAKTFDDLDFSIQKTLTSFSAETTQIISKITDNSSGALEFFDKGIKELVYNMDENSRSIGLYAKEINVDVADLSTNLRESVQTFTNQMQEGIGRTFVDFDKGLGEITLRLATILESIRESAEAIQHAMKPRD